MIVPGITPETFLIEPKNKEKILSTVANWDDNPAGLVTLYRTYLRKKENGALETWNECVVRVIEGMFSIQKTHVLRTGLIWDEVKAQRTAYDAALRLLDFKWTPPGRGLWMMGTEFMWSRGGAALNNPLHEDTPILTKEYGWVSLKDIENTTVTVLSNKKLYGRNDNIPYEPVWATASISKKEIHPCAELTFTHEQSSTTTKIIASENHRWFIKKLGRPGWSRVETTELVIGDQVPITTEYNAESTAILTSYSIIGYNNVICATVPEYEQFVIKDNILTSNCGFVTTEYIDSEGAEPFKFLMDMSMLGVGIGFDTLGANKVTVQAPVGDTIIIDVDDTREGWVDAVGQLIDSYFFGTNPIDIVTDRVREYGEPIKGFGGVASGPVPLIQGFNGIKDILDKCIGKKITSVNITDIQNIIGKIVVAGNVRRCLPETTQVLVNPTEWKNIADVTTEDRVFIHGSYYNIKEIVYQGLQDIIAVVFDDGTFIESTPNHKWLVFSHYDITVPNWVMAKDLNENHYFIDNDMAFNPRLRVVSITSRRQQAKTYDLVVDSSEHAFIARSIIGSGIGVSHNTAEIAFADAKDFDFRKMKSWSVYPESMGNAPPAELASVCKEDYNTLKENLFNDEAKQIAEKYKHEKWAYKFGGWRWTSNNSIFATVGMDYSEIAESIAENGEPGLAWLENMQNYGRMIDAPDYADHRVRGGNPCLEQSLEPYELCCLVETYPSKHDSAKDFYDTLKVAYLYAKTVTLMGTHNPKTNTVMCRNRRIGTSQSGCVDAMAKFGRHYYQKNMLDKAYQKLRYFDKKYSEWLGIPKSIKISSVKPSGSVSLLANVSPGIHFPKVRYGYRTMRLAKNSPIVTELKKANYRVEDSYSDPYTTVVAYFPIIGSEDIPTESDSSIWEQFTNAVLLQRYWADNQVSCTVSFKPAEKHQIAKCLSVFDSELKGISLLPIYDHGYKQSPYIHATKEEVVAYKKSLKPLDFSLLNIVEGENSGTNKFCDGDVCMIN